MNKSTSLPTVRWGFITDLSDPNLPFVAYEQRADGFINWVLCICLLEVLVGQCVTGPQRIFQRLARLFGHSPSFHHLLSLASPHQDLLEKSWPLVHSFLTSSSDQGLVSFLWPCSIRGTNTDCGILGLLCIASLSQENWLHCFMPWLLTVVALG